MTQHDQSGGVNRERGSNCAPLAAVRVLFGSALLVAPGALLGDLAPQGQIDTGVRVFARVLGARHLVEAAMLWRHRSRGWILASAGIDATHGVTMLALAALDPKRRRLALANAIAASAITIAGLREARRA